MNQTEKLVKALEKIAGGYYGKVAIVEIAQQAIESYKGSNTEIGETNFPLKIWANIYNPIKPDSWDLYVTEKAAVASSIGAKTHCYIHESIAQQPLLSPPQTKTI